jgi:hypothetical protein
MAFLVNFAELDLSGFLQNLIGSTNLPGELNAVCTVGAPERADGSRASFGPFGLAFLD